MKIGVSMLCIGVILTGCSSVIPETSIVSTGQELPIVVSEPEDMGDQPLITQDQLSQVTTNPNAQELDLDEDVSVGQAIQQSEQQKLGITSTQTPGTYISYTPENLKTSLTGTNIIVLFFYAGWCPTCKELESNILSNPSSIPSRMVIMKVDYDKEVSLKKQYGITKQNTLVYLNAQGKEIKRIGLGIIELQQVINALK